MKKIKEFLEKTWADAEILELSYNYNDVLKLKIKNWKEEVFEFEFKNIFRLSFEDYLNDDISEIKGTFLYDSDSICEISIISASTDKEIASFSFFID